MKIFEVINPQSLEYLFHKQKTRSYEFIIRFNMIEKKMYSHIKLAPTNIDEVIHDSYDNWDIHKQGTIIDKVIKADSKLQILYKRMMNTKKMYENAGGRYDK